MVTAKKTTRKTSAKAGTASKASGKRTASGTRTVAKDEAKRKAAPGAKKAGKTGKTGKTAQSSKAGSKAGGKTGGKEAPTRSNPLGLEVDADVLEFIDALNRFKKRHNRQFPSWSEVLHVIRELGYRKA